MSDEAGTTTAVLREVPGGVGVTAIRVAAVRAWESLRSDRLFDDPLAIRFVEAAGWPLPSRDGKGSERAVPPNWPVSVRSIPIRTRFLDQFVQDALAAGGRQVVLLGAGLDTRAFRLDWPHGCRVFEVDLPGIVKFKESVLASTGAVPACERIVVPADFDRRLASPLTAAGLDTSAPRAFQDRVWFGWVPVGMMAEVW